MGMLMLIINLQCTCDYDSVIRALRHLADSVDDLNQEFHSLALKLRPLFDTSSSSYTVVGNQSSGDTWISNDALRDVGPIIERQVEERLEQWWRALVSGSNIPIPSASNNFHLPVHDNVSPASSVIDSNHHTVIPRLADEMFNDQPTLAQYYAPTMALPPYSDRSR
jgi:hypothetical protein